MEKIGTKTAHGSIEIDKMLGNICTLTFTHGDRNFSPLHTAHWVENSDAQMLAEGLAPVERRLAGDFFCAPFAFSDLEEAPIHGWSANSPWSIKAAHNGEIILDLDRPILGARLRKIVTLSAEAPILYQQHIFSGGEGALPVAHHPMVRLSGRGFLSLSPKRAILTQQTPLEKGRNRLAVDSISDDMTQIPDANGDKFDATILPIGTQHEDFQTLIEADHTGLGWTSIIREQEDDIVFFVKCPKTFPITMLWHSNGGRDYAPWNGRHFGVLGIEDGCAAGVYPHSVAIAPNPITSYGVKTALTLGGNVATKHVMGCIARPKGWYGISKITQKDQRLVLEATHGAQIAIPFNMSFFAEGASDGNY